MMVTDLRRSQADVNALLSPPPPPPLSLSHRQQSPGTGCFCLARAKGLANLSASRRSPAKDGASTTRAQITPTDDYVRVRRSRCPCYLSIALYEDVPTAGSSL